MHPWRGRSRPPQSNLPLKDPETALAERHPQLVACETFLERPLRVLEGEDGDEPTVRAADWARSWRVSLEEWDALGPHRDDAHELLLDGGLWHLTVGPGEIAGIVREDRLYAARINLPALGSRAEAALVEELEGKIPTAQALVAGDVSHEVRSRLLEGEEGLLPPLSRARWKCQCGSRKVCVHVAALLIGSAIRITRRPAQLFRLRRTSPEVLRGLLPDEVNQPLPDGATPLDPAEVAKVFEFRLYVPEPLPELDAPPPAAPAVPEPVAPEPAGDGWLSDDWDEDDGPVFGGSTETIVTPEPSKTPAPVAEVVPAAPVEAEASASEDLPEVGRADLLDLGLPSHRIQKMLADGRLVRTERRGRYQLTPEAWEEIEPLLPDN